MKKMFNMIVNFKKKRNIKNILNQFKISNYVINNDLSVDVYEDVIMNNDNNNKPLKSIPLKFGKVTGSFFVRCQRLTSLHNCPYEVTEQFDCSENLLTSLEFCPKKVGASFICNDNQLTSLKYCPENINGSLFCYNNEIATFEYFPKEIKVDLKMQNNKILKEELANFKTVVHTHILDDFFCNNNKFFDEVNYQKIKQEQQNLEGILNNSCSKKSNIYKNRL